MWDFLKALFCSDLQTDITNLENEVTTLKDDIAEKEKAIKALNTAIESYLIDIASLRETVDHLTTELARAQSDIVTQLNRISSIEAALVNAIVIPDLSSFLDPKVVVEPFQHPEIGRVNPDTHKMIYDIEVADLEYYAFSKENWLALLELVKIEVKRHLGTPSIPMTDCDNHAEMTSLICHKAFINAGLDRHGAVFVGEMSGVHVYNGFITDTGEVWIYDAMKRNDSLIGVLGETTGNYKTTDIIFSG